jgi:hypothetical protein
MLKNKNKIRSKYKIKIISLVMTVLIILPIISGCGEKESQKYLVDLEVWGVFDDNSDFAEIIGEFKKVKPFVYRVTYKKITLDIY